MTSTMGYIMGYIIDFILNISLWFYSDVYTGKYVSDLFEGTARYTYSCRTLKCEGSYVAGEKDGDWIHYNYEGTIDKIETYVKGECIAYSVNTYSNGKREETKYLSQKAMNNTSKKYIMPNILKTKWDSSGNIYAKESYYNDCINQLPHLYQIVGWKAVDRDKTMHGTFKVWYPNGTLHKKSKYKYGVLDGISKEFYPDGTLQMKCR